MEPTELKTDGSTLGDGNRFEDNVETNSGSGNTGFVETTKRFDGVPFMAANSSSAGV